jgi:hypothetical protein
MDLNRVIQELQAERRLIEEAIIVLERLAEGKIRRRGRPPAWLSRLKAQQQEQPSSNQTLSRESRRRKTETSRKHAAASEHQTSNPD